MIVVKGALLVAAGVVTGAVLSAVNWLAGLTFNVAYFTVLAAWIRAVAAATFERFDEDPGLASASQGKLSIETLRIHGMFARIVKSDRTPAERAPVVIMHHGYGSTYRRMLVYAHPVALAGYAVLLYNAPGHGKIVKEGGITVDERSPGDKTGVMEIMRMVSRVVDFITARPDLGPVAFVGTSLGAIVALTHAACHPAVQCVVGMAAVHDFKDTATRRLRRFSSSWWMIKSFAWSGLEMQPTTLQDHMVSPAFYHDKIFGYFDHPVWADERAREKIHLIHAKDDCTVPFSEFEKNVQALGLPPERYLALEHGNHWFIRQEHLVTGQLLAWLGTSIGSVPPAKVYEHQRA